jgi:hypothetical protein
MMRYIKIIIFFLYTFSLFRCQELHFAIDRDFDNEPVKTLPNRYRRNLEIKSEEEIKEKIGIQTLEDNSVDEAYVKNDFHIINMVDRRYFGKKKGNTVYYEQITKFYVSKKIKFECLDKNIPIIFYVTETNNSTNVEYRQKTTGYLTDYEYTSKIIKEQKRSKSCLFFKRFI